jgi:hypothetical protein
MEKQKNKIELLVEKYPRLYADLSYLEVHDGWADLLTSLSDRLIEHFEANPEAQVVQVKEKFGGLRFYVEGCGDEEQHLINQFERASFKVCEFCGEPGSVGRLGFRRNDETSKKSFGWVKTMCPSCEEEQAVAREKERW